MAGQGPRHPRLLIAATSEVTLRAFLVPYADHFRDLGWTVDGMAHGAGSSLECAGHFDHVWDARWQRTPVSLQNIRAVGDILGVARRGSYDIVHVHTPVAGLVTRLTLGLMMPRKRPSLVYTAHGFHFHSRGSPAQNALFAAIEKAAGRWTDRLVVMNDDDRQAALRYRLVPPERLTFMPGIGLDIDAWQRDHIPDDHALAIRRELHLTEADSLFLMVAEYNPGKRHRDALNAMAALDRDDVHLAIAGEGPLEGEIRQMAIALDIDKRIHLLGFRSDIPALMCASTAVLLPSEREGLPRTVMEAMSLGVPVIGSNIRGIRDLLDDGAGILVDVGNISAYSAAMVTVLEDDAMRSHLVSNAWSRIDEYSLAEIIRLHEVMYHELLGDSVDT